MFYRYYFPKPFSFFQITRRPYPGRPGLYYPLYYETVEHKKTSNTKVLKVVVASTGLNNLLRIKVIKKTVNESVNWSIFACLTCQILCNKDTYFIPEVDKLIQDFVTVVSLPLGVGEWQQSMHIWGENMLHKQNVCVRD
jgi:hypothetical protein